MVITWSQILKLFLYHLVDFILGDEFWASVICMHKLVAALTHICPYMCVTCLFFRNVNSYPQKG